jgi:endonuclease-3
MAATGSYVIVVSCEEPIEIEVGALGEHSFEGGYAYVGSAFGPGGLTRVDRHREVAGGEREIQHWHIDYLLSADQTQLTTVETYPDRDIECALAMAFDDAGCQAVESFGASDCGCGSHCYSLGESSLMTVLPSVI